MSAYRIERELGRGGMAVVYEAWHEKLERRVALKVLAAHLADDDEFRTRFLREARIAARPSHPTLVRTHDIDELLAGRTAQDTALLERCRANDPELRPSAAEVAAALDGDTLVAPTQVLARHHTHARGRIALLAALLVAVVVAVAVAGFSSGGSATIEPVPHGTSASQQAKNLGAWLERYSK